MRPTSYFFQAIMSIHCLENACLCTKSPIIGIMAQQLPIHERTPNASSFIPTTYVETVESSGARVVPIFINQTEEYYQAIIRKVNGVLIPGGATDFLEKGGIGQSTEIVISEAKKLNQQGVHFPILGICWGFQLFLYLSNEKKPLMKECYCKNVSLDLHFNHHSSKADSILEKMPVSIRNTLQGSSPLINPEQSLIEKFMNEIRSLTSFLSPKNPDQSQEILHTVPHLPVTFNDHRWCVTEQNFTANHLNIDWTILSFSTTEFVGSNGTKEKIDFISGIESIEFPFVGLQFHPESTLFSWWSPEIQHFRQAILANHFFYDWLVDEASMNDNEFPTREEEFSSLIWNYQPSFFKKAGNAFPTSQRYFFKQNIKK